MEALSNSRTALLMERALPSFAYSRRERTAVDTERHPYGERRALVTYDAACIDEETRRRFARYWALASPGAGIVFRAVPRAIKAAAEAEAR